MEGWKEGKESISSVFGMIFLIPHSEFRIPKERIPMRCTQAQKVFFPILSGNLNPETQREFKQHLNHCSKCQAKWQQLQASHQMLESLADEYDIPKAPVDFWQRLEHRLEPPTKKLGIPIKFSEIFDFVWRTTWIPREMPIFRKWAIPFSLLLVLGLGLIGYGIFHSQSPNYFEHGYVQKEIYLLENLMNYSELDDVNILDLSPPESNSFNPTVEHYLLDRTEVNAIQDISAEGLPLIEEVFYISELSDKRIL